MRIARTLVLALAAAIATMAMAATSANAQTIHAENETTGAACSVALQNCKIVASSEAGGTTIRGHAFGFEATQSVCDDVFTGYMNEDGTGHIVDQSISGQECTFEPCDATVESGTEIEWPIHSLTEVGAAPEEFEMEITYCLADLNSNHQETAEHCTINVHVNQIDHHNAEFQADDEPCHGTNESTGEVTGHWVTDAAQSDEIKVVHTTP